MQDSGRAHAPRDEVEEQENGRRVEEGACAQVAEAPLTAIGEDTARDTACRSGTGVDEDSKESCQARLEIGREE